MPLGQRGWADLPFDVLRHVVQDAEEFTPPGPQGMWGYEPVAAADRNVTLAEMLAAGAVCRSWRRAMGSATVGSLTIGGSALPGKRAWLARGHPGARNLRIYCSAASQEGQAMLGCLRGEDTVEAEVGHVPHCLPDPAMLPNLRRQGGRGLTIHCLDFDAGWLERLALLPHLASLELAVAAPKQGTGSEGQPLQLPALAALRSLKAYLEPRAPLLRICVNSLPALEEVELWGSQRDNEEDRGAAQLARCGSTTAAGTGGATPSRLRSLSLDLSRAEVDWAALPNLEEAEIWAAHLQGSASLAAVTRLTSLQLGSDAALRGSFGAYWEYSLDKPWLATALAALPPSLRVLRLQGGRMSQEAAQALTNLRGLSVLCLSLSENEMEEEEEEEEEEPELGPGPLWEGLKALRWASGLPLPQALAGAQHLEMLDWTGIYCPDQGVHSTEEEVRMLAGLPALRHLLVAVRGKPPPALQAQLQRAMPHLHSLTVGSMMQARSEKAFLQAAEAAGVIGGQA